MLQQLSAIARPTGAVSVRKIGAVVNAPLEWKLQNNLRWSYVKGWLAFHVVAPILRKIGAGTFIADLQLKQRTWYDDIDREHFLKLRKAGDITASELYALTRTYWIDYGIVSYRLVTNNGVGFIVDAFQGIVEPEIMNYHGIGTTNTAEAAGDSALVAESTTALNPDSTRATGTQTEPSSNQYRSTGTLTADATIAAVEHGLFSQAATGGGVLFDRSIYTVINLASADSLQAQYTVTFTAGG